MSDLNPNAGITVCDECHRACCWQGEFMCEDAQCAGTLRMTVAELRDGQYGEHEDYWRSDAEMCATCNGWGFHPADGGSYPCPDCKRS